MKFSNPVVFVLLSIFTAVNILDGMTGLFILPAEANPIFLLFGSFTPLIIGKIIICLVAWWIYSKNLYSSKLFYYSFILVITLGTLLMSIGILSNVIGIMNPDTVEASSTIPTAQKVQAYGIFVGFIGLLPWAISLLTFYLYEKSKKYVRIMK